MILTLTSLQIQTAGAIVRQAASRVLKPVVVKEVVSVAVIVAVVARVATAEVVARAVIAVVAEQVAVSAVVEPVAAPGRQVAAVDADNIIIL